ncbi:MAG: hydrogenase nickel incorporation protein HypB [Chloroflexi bacterium]|nr:hydrogenase nickel incorporation protein HypB [Chloroflexota bacterium]
MTQVKVMKDILQTNNSVAGTIRTRYDSEGVLVLNFVSSPGAGKTTLLERTVAGLKNDMKIGVVEGDLSTSLDAERIAQHGIPVIQINTDGGCHLEAWQVNSALAELPDEHFDMLIIENVGNLVCPTNFDLGEDKKVLVMSLTEGDDKPLKYPGSFTAVEAVVINKIDLAPYLPAKVETMRENALSINPHLKIFEVSCTSGEGLDAWFQWVRDLRAAKGTRLTGEQPTNA